MLLAVAAVAFSPAFVAGTDRNTAVNESITVDYTQPVSVANDAVEYGETATVYDADGNELAAGTDYSWNATAGNVTWQNTSQTTDGETAAITYDYRTADDQQRTTAGIVSIFGTALMFLGPLLAVGYVYRELV